MKKVKFTIEDTQFNINNEKKCVTCIITGFYNIDGNALSWGALESILTKNAINCRKENVRNLYCARFIGQCTYKEGDKFDPKLACAIAESKAKRQMFSIVTNIIKDIKDQVKKQYLEFSDDEYSAMKYKEREDEHIKELISNL